MKTNYFNRIFSYAWIFKKFFILNIFSNIFYAFFGTLSMISLFPMLKVLFNQTEQLNSPPLWNGVSDLMNYSEDYLNYFVTLKKTEGNKRLRCVHVLLVFSARSWRFYNCCITRAWCDRRLCLWVLL